MCEDKSIHRSSVAYWAPTGFWQSRAWSATGATQQRASLPVLAQMFWRSRPSRGVSVAEKSVRAKETKVWKFLCLVVLTDVAVQANNAKDVGRAAVCVGEETAGANLAGSRGRNGEGASEEGGSGDEELHSEEWKRVN